MPTGGVQTSLAGMVSQLTAAFRRKGGATNAKGAPIASYTPNYGGPVQGQQNPADLTQFAPVFQPSGGMFAPGYPLPPPELERLRRWDFHSGYNYIYTPRSFEPVSFHELRALAQNHDITRLAIETRKDQIEALEWVIKPIDEKKPKAGADTRAEKQMAFWKKPDGINPFVTWLRELLEDLLVLDAPTLDVRINRAGEIIALDLVDGATIKVLIDDTGRRPLPPAPAFEQVIHGRPWVLTEDGRVSTDLRGKPIFNSQLIYLPRNPRTHKAYGFSPVEQIIMTVNIGLRRQVMQLQHFTEGNVPPGMATSPDGWNADQIAKYQEWFDSMLAGNTGQRTRIIWGPAGAKYQSFKEAPYKDEFDEWLARIVCYAFSLPPTAFVKQMNRATAGTAQETALEEGLAPVMNWVKRLVDTVIQDRMGQLDLEFSWKDVRPVDPKDQADILKEYVSEGIYTINEARDILGMDPIEGGDLPMIVTASGPVLLKNIEALGEQQLNPPQPMPVPGAAAAGGAPGGKPAPSSPGGAGKPPAKPNGKQPAEGKNADKIAKEFNEDQHPRDEHGQFTDGAGDPKESFTGEERGALRYWTGDGGSGPMNQALREQSSLSQEHADIVKTMDEAFDRVRLPEDMTTFRGVGEKALENWATENIGIGTVITDHGFMGTSSDNHYAKAGAAFGGIGMEIHLPAGSKAIDVSKLSRFETEHEVLVARDSSFRVTAWDADKRWLRMELLK